MTAFRDESEPSSGGKASSRLSRRLLVIAAAIPVLGLMVLLAWGMLQSGEEQVDWP